MNLEPPSAALVAGLLAASTMTIMAGATIAPALPAMADAFAAVPSADLRVRLVLTITALAIALAAPGMGILGDRVGRGRVLLVSIALYVLAGSAGLYLDDLNLLLASRVLLGVAVAGVMTATAGLIGDLFAGPARGRILGFQGAAMGFGGVIFLGLGGALAEIGWRGPFVLYLLPAALLILLPLTLPRRVDPASQAAGPQVALAPAPTALILAAAFVAMIGFYALPVQLPFLLLDRGWPGPSVGGLSLAGLTLISALTSLGSARLFRNRPLPRFAPATFALIGAGLLVVAAGQALWVSALGLALTGVGMGLLMPLLSGWLLLATAPDRRGRVMGGLTAALFLGQFASPIVLQPVIGWGGLAAGIALAGALPLIVTVAFAISNRTRANDETEPALHESGASSRVQSSDQRAANTKS